MQDCMRTSRNFGNRMARILGCAGDPIAMTLALLEFFSNPVLLSLSKNDGLGMVSAGQAATYDRRIYLLVDPDA